MSDNSNIDDSLSLVTGGLATTIPGNTGSLTAPGSTLPSAAAPNPNEIAGGVQLSPATLSLLSQNNALGSAVSVGAGGVVSFNVAGSTLSTPAVLSPTTLTSAIPIDPSTGPEMSFAGSDIMVMLDLPQQPWLKPLVELQTLAISTHRSKTPSRALGYIGPKGYARGTRTVAGTMILTQFGSDFLYQFLSSVQSDVAVSSNYTEIDQVLPFNLTILFADELGNASYCRLLGVDIVTSGVTMSIHDGYTEQTVSFVAADATPVMPLSISSLLFPQDPSIQPSTTSRDLILSKINALSSSSLGTMPSQPSSTPMPGSAPTYFLS